MTYVVSTQVSFALAAALAGVAIPVIMYYAAECKRAATGPERPSRKMSEEADMDRPLGIGGLSSLHVGFFDNTGDHSEAPLLLNIDDETDSDDSDNDDAGGLRIISGSMP